jgi:glutathione synthase/RimK-type ligase-like ATP-grasp enzyme
LKGVGLIGPPNRPELERLAIRIEERGGTPIFLDPRQDPDITIEGGRLSGCGEDLSSLLSLYVTDLGLRPRLAASSTGTDDTGAGRRALARSMRDLAAWNALFAAFAANGGRVVNPPSAQALHSLKPHEIAACAMAGLTVPRTVATTDPAELGRLRAAGEAWVIKGMVGGYSHTERLAPPATPAEAERLASAGPVLAQERIEGDNVRAFVIGGECAGAAEIMTLDGTEIDSRRGEARIRRIDIPEEAARQAVAAAAMWKMSFAAVDFMREEATGRYVILECNSAPFFVQLEASTGIEISGRLAGLLLGIRRGR